MTAHWYALHVKPHNERYVHHRLSSPENLASLFRVEAASVSIESFFPAVRVKPANPRASKIRPYFPGYLFVHADLEILGGSAFNWIPGVHGLVRYGDEPAVVPDSLIHDLKDRMAQLDAAGVLRVDKFKPGETVRITGGPFTGYEAIFDARLPGKDRVQVLLAFLSSHPQRVQLAADDLENVKKP